MINKFLLKEFGNRIRYLRTQDNLSQEELAYKTGFHRTYIGMIERAERNISLTNMAIFAKTFNLTLDELLKFDNSKKLLKKVSNKNKTLMSRNHSFKLTLSNNVTEKEGINFLINEQTGFFNHY